MKFPKSKQPFWKESRLVMLCNDFINIRSMKTFFLDVPKGTFNYNKHVNEIQKSTGTVTNTIDYLCQIPYINLLMWIPLWFLFVVMCAILDIILLVWYIFKKTY